ncbi:MAG: hypothetical protein P4M11_14365 [Candidatus Pacebacteria bacterium]|nr:hypothetical protein [Candidatus Paceibacterota bacterium]
MSARGAIGESARQLLHKLASTVDEVSGHAFLQDAYARLSVALQSANAAIMIGGLQRLRVNQLSCDLPMSPGVGQRAFASRRRTARRIAENTRRESTSAPPSTAPSARARSAGLLPRHNQQAALQRASPPLYF